MENSAFMTVNFGGNLTHLLQSAFDVISVRAAAKLPSQYCSISRGKAAPSFSVCSREETYLGPVEHANQCAPIQEAVLLFARRLRQ
jgi:hypothetical protein